MKKSYYAPVISLAFILTACNASGTDDGGLNATGAGTSSIQGVQTAETESSASAESTSEGAGEKTPQLISTQELESSFKIGEKTGKVILESYDDGGYLLKVTDGDETLGEVEMNAAHPGNKDVYISLKEEQPYLVVYTPYVMQGDADLRYEVLTWQDGTQSLLAEDSIQFRYALYTDADMPVAEIAAYAEQLSGYLENSRLLVSVDTEGIRTEEAAEDDYTLFDRLLPIADRAVYDELELSTLDNMEEKLTKLNAYYKETYAQHRSSEK